MDGRVTEENVFKERLNDLIAAADHRPTNRMTIESLDKQGVRISQAYLSQLRTGIRKHPSRQMVLALADYFKVPAGYFYTEPRLADRHHIEETDSNTINRLSQSGIKNLLKTANGLPPDSLGLLADMSMKFRVADGLILDSND